MARRPRPTATRRSSSVVSRAADFARDRVSQGSELVRDTAREVTTRTKPVKSSGVSPTKEAHSSDPPVVRDSSGNIVTRALSAASGPEASTMGVAKALVGGVSDIASGSSLGEAASNVGSDIIGNINEFTQSIPRVESSGSDLALGLMPGGAVVGAARKVAARNATKMFMYGGRLMTWGQLQKLIAQPLSVRTATALVKNKGVWTTFKETSEAVGTKVLTGKYLSSLGLRAAKGILPPVGQQKHFLNLLSGARNTKSERLFTKGISKVASYAKNHKAVLALIASTAMGTKMMAEWGGGEAVDTLSFNHAAAVELGDTEMAQEIESLMEDMTNPSLWNQMQDYIPIVGMIDELKIKWEAARQKIDLTKQKADLILNADPDNPEYGTPQWWANKEIEDEIRTQEYRDFALFLIAEKDRQNAEWRESEEEQRAYQEEIDAEWARIRAEQAAQDEIDRQFWLDYAEKQRQWDLETQAFWEEYQRNKSHSSTTGSSLNFGLL